MILDKTFMATEGPRNAGLRAWVERAFELWGGGARRSPGTKGIELMAATITSPLELRSLLRSEIAEGEREVVRLTDEQLYTLNMLRGMRRAAVVGGAGAAGEALAFEALENS